MYLLVKFYTFGLTTGRMSLNVFYLLNHYTHAGMLHVMAVSHTVTLAPAVIITAFTK